MSSLLLGPGLFSGAFAVSFRGCTLKKSPPSSKGLFQTSAKYSLISPHLSMVGLSGSPLKGGLGGIAHPPIGSKTYHLYTRYIAFLKGHMLPIPPFRGTSSTTIEFMTGFLGPPCTNLKVRSAIKKPQPQGPVATPNLS